MKIRTFTEVALCHLPDHEIRWLNDEVRKGCTTIYQNEAGFFVWRGNQLVNRHRTLLAYILNKATTDYVLFDVDVEPDPELEIFDAY